MHKFIGSRKQETDQEKKYVDTRHPVLETLAHYSKKVGKDEHYIPNNCNILQQYDAHRY